MSDINKVIGPLQPVNGPNVSTVTTGALTTAGVGVPVTLPQPADSQPINQVQNFDVLNQANVAVAVAFALTSAAAVTASQVVATATTPGPYTIAPGARVTLTVVGFPLFAAVSPLALGSTGGVYITPGTGKP